MKQPSPARPDDDPKIGTVKSATRVVELFELFDRERRPMTVGEIVSKLGYPQSSTSILVKGMVSLGYMDFDPSRRSYMPSLRVAALGAWLNAYFAPAGNLADLLDDLSRETGHTIIVGQRSGLDSLYVQVVEAVNAIRLHVAAGTRRIFVWSAVGFVLMTRMTDEEIGALVRRTNAEMMAGRPHINFRDVLKKVDAVRRDGYVYSRGLVTPAAGMICLALPGIRDSKPLVIALAGAVEEFDRSERQLVDTLSAAITRHFGREDKSHM